MKLSEFARRVRELQVDVCDGGIPAIEDLIERGIKMKEITLNIDGKEIKATVSEEEIEKLTKKEWPQEGEPYWWVSGAGMPRPYNFDNDSSDRLLMSIGNMYRTKQEAYDAIRAQKLIAAIAKRRKELNGDWKPDWKDNGEKWMVATYSRRILGVDMRKTINWASPFGVYEEYISAKTIIEEFRDELKWYFTEYTVSVN